MKSEIYLLFQTKINQLLIVIVKGLEKNYGQRLDWRNFWIILLIVFVKLGGSDFFDELLDLGVVFLSLRKIDVIRLTIWVSQDVGLGGDLLSRGLGLNLGLLLLVVIECLRNILGSLGYIGESEVRKVQVQLAPVDEENFSILSDLTVADEVGVISDDFRGCHAVSILLLLDNPKSNSVFSVGVDEVFWVSQISDCERSQAGFSCVFDIE